MTALEQAKVFFLRGWALVALFLSGEGPRTVTLESPCLTEAELPGYCEDPTRIIAALLGKPSGDLVVARAVASEAQVHLAKLLPKTGLVHGTASAPRSHFWFIAPGAETRQWSDLDGTVLVELKSTGSFEILPPWPNASGDPQSWAENGEPGQRDAAYLESTCGFAAASTLLVRHLPTEPGARREAFRALIGALLRDGYDQDLVTAFARAIAEGVGDTKQAKKIGSTVANVKVRLDEKKTTVKGWTSLKALLGSKGAEYVKLVREWLNPDEAEDLEESESNDPSTPFTLYHATNEGLFFGNPNGESGISRQLSNFTARIGGDVAADTGTDTERHVEIEAVLKGKSSRFTIPVAEFREMKWPMSHLGPEAIVSAGRDVSEHLRVAIQSLSGSITKRIVFGHTGWRKTDEKWIYLHAEGGIGADGPVPGIEVYLPAKLSNFVLPIPPTSDPLVTAVRASLDMLAVAPYRITILLLATTYRAVLGPSDMSLHLVGETGVQKSELLALAQQHHGKAMNRKNLPTAFQSTPSAIEALAFAAKDTLLGVDDFKPGGTAQDQARAHRDADRIIRAQGNQQGRDRLRPDGTLQTTKSPRGTIMTTGEDVPMGASTVGRMCIIAVKRGDVVLDVLTRCQKDAIEGRYAESMAGFVKYLAPQFANVQANLPRMVAELAPQFRTSGTHSRMPRYCGQPTRCL